MFASNCSLNHLNRKIHNFIKLTIFPLCISNDILSWNEHSENISQQYIIPIGCINLYLKKVEALRKQFPTTENYLEKSKSKDHNSAVKSSVRNKFTMQL